jgi:hypothetical protein
MNPTGSVSPTSAPSPARAGEDWASATADTIERVVDSVREKTAEPLQRVARTVVYGLLVALVAITIAVLVLIAVVRGLVILVGLIWEPEVWVVYLALGGIFSVAGLFLWRKANRPSAKA